MKVTLKFQNRDDVTVNLDSVPRIHERLKFSDGTFIVADVVTIITPNYYLDKDNPTYPHSYDVYLITEVKLNQPN